MSAAVSSLRLELDRAKKTKLWSYVRPSLGDLRLLEVPKIKDLLDNLEVLDLFKGRHVFDGEAAALKFVNDHFIWKVYDADERREIEEYINGHS